ncbi:hypothetical protein F3Y22_tig00017808pilonHSYRG00054 [Hibiscus syriacus]|uniref:Uncharacterized protein n=1 Tax=Hibiscus syriacus TaxID=106335 RepID=A0A6A3BZU1_HIBSY|nr:hypothetical protein F3Y22_tig00017808pilonHSYRG00054 [Hibiscus syriacus]
MTEEAVRAYDEAACLLRGASTRTNFWPCSSSSSALNPTPTFSSKISNRLLQRIKANKYNLRSPSPPPPTSSSSPPPVSINSNANHEIFNAMSVVDNEEELQVLPTMAAENFVDEHSMMSYERKFSASLYAFNGIPELLGSFHDGTDIRSVWSFVHGRIEEGEGSTRGKGGTRG